MTVIAGKPRTSNRGDQRQKLLRAALRYAAQGWAVFPLQVGGKRPLPGSSGFKDASTNPKVIKRWWADEPYNIGIRCDSETGPIVLDVDGPEGEAILPGLKLPVTRMATSGRSGRRHFYFAPSGRRVGRKTKVRPALDLLGDGGYVVAPPSIHPETGKPYRWLNDADLAVLPANVLKLTKKATAHAAPLPDKITEGQRDELLTSLAGSARRRGASEDGILALLREENESRCHPPLDDKQLRKIARSIGAKPAGDEADAPLDELNERYALVRIGKDSLILEQGLDGRSYDLLSERTFRLSLNNRSIPRTKVTANGTTTVQVPRGDAWLRWEGRRGYNRLVFKPGETDVPADEFNLWRGWGVAPSPTGSCARFLRHLRDVVCNGNAEHYEWLLDWLADIVQHPQRKLGYAVALQGRQGAGKTLVGLALKHLLGPHRVVVDKPRQVTGNFNAHLETCLLLQTEEAFWAGDKAAEGTLKNIVTGADLPIERKGVDTVNRPNYTRLLITTNAEWTWPTSLDDRRLVIFGVSNRYADAPLGSPRAVNRLSYFDRLHEELSAPRFAPRLLHELLTRPIDELRLRQPPRTKALEEQAIHSMSPEETWLRDVLMRGELPFGCVVDEAGRAHVRVMRLYDSYTESVSKRQHVMNEEAFSLFRKRHLLPVRDDAVAWQGESRHIYSEGRGKHGRTTQSRRVIILPLADCRARYSDRGRAAPTVWPSPKRWRVAQ